MAGGAGLRHRHLPDCSRGYPSSGLPERERSLRLVGMLRHHSDAVKQNAAWPAAILQSCRPDTLFKMAVHQRQQAIGSRVAPLAASNQGPLAALEWRSRMRESASPRRGGTAPLNRPSTGTRPVPQVRHPGRPPIRCPEPAATHPYRRCRRRRPARRTPCRTGARHVKASSCSLKSPGKTKASRPTSRQSKPATSSAGRQARGAGSRPRLQAR